MGCMKFFLLAVFVCGFGFGFYDNRDSRIFNAFALTARMDNAQLHPGCRCALPWAMFFCAYSACWSIYFLRTSSQSKSGTTPFWVHQTVHHTCLHYIYAWIIMLTCIEIISSDTVGLHFLVLAPMQENHGFRGGKCCSECHLLPFSLPL